MAWSRGGLSLSLVFLAVLNAGGTSASELKPHTVKAFQQYEELTEARIQSELSTPGQFLAIDSLPEAQREEEISRLKSGQVYIRTLTTKDNDKKIEIPDGLVHHWLAIGFIPHARLQQVIGVVQDYPRQADIFKPDVQRAELLSRDGEHFHVYFRFYRHAIVTAVYNTKFDIDFTQSDPTHEYSFARATRIAEVRDPGEKDESERPVGNDRGYLWRLDLYTRYLETSDGVYVQIEFLTLSRGVPAVFAWLVNPYLKSVPRDYLTNYIGKLRTATTGTVGETAEPKQ
ncbi:MAG TPA: hypothetical protein VK728_05285 [Candidatus Sulfotelmatobacter sp.]|jgi:hypothetical protein|nr:hypothetical protein [Candidatus Sulfotelmatobacter sp.]